MSSQLRRTGPATTGVTLAAAAALVVATPAGATLPTAPAAAPPTAAASAPAANPAGPKTAAADSTAGKGPVGWDIYRNPERIGELSTGVETKQFSSFDRVGGNDDGFVGSYSCLNKPAAGQQCVLAERQGAGEISSIWFTRDEGDITKTGNIHITLDGKEVVNAKIQDLVDGKQGAPFVYPFVANADQSSGGVYIKVPMTFTKSMKVTTDNNPLFYHVGYRTFADAKGVSTFDPKAYPADVIAAAKNWGKTDPKHSTGTPSTATKTVDLAPGAQAQLASFTGSGALSQIKLAGPQLTAPQPLPLIGDDGRAFTGSSQFTVSIDPNNTGVTLKRRFDAASNRQRATIYVDGVKVGEWAPTDDIPGYWAYQTVTLPASATAGKSKITVKNEFVSASIDYNEFRYWVTSLLPASAGGPKQTDELDVGTSAAALASEQAHDYQITGQTWSGAPRQSDKPENPEDPKVLASNELLRNVYLRVSFDGKQTVNSPLGEFFGDGLVANPVAALYFSVVPDAGGGATLTSWWPMPHAKNVTVSLVNSSEQPLRGLRAGITDRADAAVAGQLRSTPNQRPSLGYFNATHQREQTEFGKDASLLTTAGTGKFVGVSQTMRGAITSGNIRNYLEGDERVYTNGTRSPAMYGTGTEDFYESGWYFNRGEFSNPMQGAPAMLTKMYGCQYQCDAPYRLMIGDAVPFDSSINFGIEHGPTANEPAEYSSTAYWYGFDDTPSARVTDAIDVGVAASEKAHTYTDATGGVTAKTVSYTYEGDFDTEPVTQQVTASTAAVSFTVSVDPRNVGVTLRRLSDQAKGYQSAAVTVDGAPAGTWLQPLANTTHRWLQDTYQLDPALTAGKSELKVTLTPTAGSAPWSAASYEVLSVGALAQDRQLPTGVTGLVAIGTDSNANRLRWNDSTGSIADNVGVDHYQIYASRSRAVPTTEANLVGTSHNASFTHEGLGLNETWYYRVRAVDASGNVGRPSAVVSATSGNQLRIEGERLLPAVSSTAETVSQGNCCGVSWSGGAQLWLRGQKSGDTATVAFTVPVSGDYTATAVLSKAVDYGIVQLAVDGKNVGSGFDGYQATGVGTAQHDLGTLALTAGRHTLTLTVTGKNAAATGYFVGLDYLSLATTASGVKVTDWSKTEEVVQAGARQRIYDPSVGENEPWYINDHTFVQGPDGKWNMFGITHAEPADPLNESFFAHATADTLTQKQYSKQAPVIQADPALGEKHVWAPYVLKDGDTYYMFYAAGLDDNHSTHQLRLATSKDLKTWTKRKEPLFVDGFDARDPMVMRIGNQWVMYYTANSTPEGGNHQVAYRTSTDLVNWGPKQVAFNHPVTGTFGGPTESPFVVAKDGWYYLFVCCESGYTDTRVYKSKDPFSFNVDQLAGRIDAHAAEVVQDTDGRWYISGAGWGQGGLYLAPLDWNAMLTTKGKNVETSNYRVTVQTAPQSSVTDMQVADGSGGWRPALNNDYRGTGPYLGVGNFGNTDTAGAAGSVSATANSLTLKGIPLGNEPVTADWKLDFARASFTSSITAKVTGALSAPAWEVSTTVDGAGSRIGDNADPDRPVGDVKGFPDWTQSTGANSSVAARYTQGSAFSQDNRYYAGTGAVVWQPLWQPGGRAWAPGSYSLGTLTIGASPIGGDDQLGALLPN
ncbi:DUF2961 domain-containing protein [Nakamurella aerolata]|nr:DUF2961 domain-containing protein [Nakamurella aerolata]